MVFLIGDLKHEDLRRSNVKHASHIRDAEGVEDGDIVLILGHAVRWSLNECVSEAVCRRWRVMDDPICDAAIETVFRESSTAGNDLLQSLQDHIANNPHDDAATAFLDEVSRAPPPGLCVDPRDIPIAQAFFLDYAIQIMQALLHYSLAAGFASPRIVRTLRAVSYFMPPEKAAEPSKATSKAADDRTFARLLETFQFVLDVMGCVVSPSPADPACNIESGPSKAYLLPGGEGWKAAVRVRMLHAVARRRIRQRYARDDCIHDQASEGVPISQEDMAATLASFSTVPIWALQRLHLNPDPDAVRAYLALWRHVGFYLGVSPDILTRYLSDPATADKFLASVTLDLFSSDDALDPRTIPTIPILRAVSRRPPSGSSLAYNCAVTRHLVGDALADHLGLPHTPLSLRLKLHWSLFVQRIPVLFGRWYPRRRWAEKRREVMREGLPRSVRWGLGMRRTTFRPRTDVRPPTLDGAGGMGGEIPEGVQEAEAVVPDFVGGKVLARKWKEVIGEMVAVCVGTVVLGSAAVFVMLR